MKETMYKKSVILLSFINCFDLPSFSTYVYKNISFVFIKLLLFTCELYTSVCIWCSLIYTQAVSDLIFWPESFKLLSGSPDSTSERHEATALEKEFQEWFIVRKTLKKEIFQVLKNAFVYHRYLIMTLDFKMTSLVRHFWISHHLN